MIIYSWYVCKEYKKVSLTEPNDKYDWIQCCSNYVFYNEPRYAIENYYLRDAVQNISTFDRSGCSTLILY